MHVTRDLSPEVCVIREFFELGRESFIFLRVSQQLLILNGLKRVCPDHGVLGVNGISVTVNHQNLTGRHL